MSYRRGGGQPSRRSVVSLPIARLAPIVDCEVEAAARECSRDVLTDYHIFVCDNSWLRDLIEHAYMQGAADFGGDDYD